MWRLYGARNYFAEMKRALFFVMVGALLGLGRSARAQDWTKVMQLTGTYGSSAFFFNAREGLIGTGHYSGSIAAQIYYTNDGGTTWQLAQFANPDIRGEVTDIYFRDRQHGWATITESTQTGWSGVYRSTDGGESWTRVKQAGFPVGVRETGRGVFYTDQDAGAGVVFSSDTGKTWTPVAITETALGIDFMDDSTGFVTRQAPGAPHLYTTDGGKTWQSITTSSESWTPYADPISRSFFLASELDQLTFTKQTTIVRVPVGAWAESKIKDYGDSGLTGGIAGSHICQSIIYVQGREPATNAPGGIIRSMDVGASWKFVGGPNNINDKRFAVTGRGAVVIAFDDIGGVWRTTDGGDGTLTSSVLPFVTLMPPNDTVRISLCDSAAIPIILGYRACDSAQISSVAFLNDSLNELRAPAYDNDVRFFSSSRPDSLNILYTPARQRSWTAVLYLTIRQPDGYTEDTIINIPLIALAPPKNVLVFSGTSAHDTINFDSVSICSDAYQSVTLNNMGCGNLLVNAVTMNGPPFVLASNFQPFTLSTGNSRTFLSHYTPDSVGENRGVLYVANSSGLDSVVLLGTGYSSGQAVSLVASDSIRSSECDSDEFTVTLKNIACKAFAIDSIVTGIPFRAGTIPTLDSLQPGAIVMLPFTFIPNALGLDTGAIHLIISYPGTGRYDTIFPVIGTGTIGKSAFSVSPNSLDMGTVPICSTATDTLVIYSMGCAGVTVSASLDSTNGFSIVRAPKSVLASPDSDVVVIGFQPNHSIGKKSANLIFTTSAGTDTVPVSVTVVASGGTVALSVTPNIQALTCQSQPFSISIANSYCDSIAIDSLTLTGANANDFSLADSLPIALGSDKQTTISGIFTPQDSLASAADVTFAIRETDGTIHDTTIALLAQGIAVPPIEVALGANSFSADAGQTVSIPVIATRGSTANMRAFDFYLTMNTDLLTPFASSTNGFFGTIAPTISVSRAMDKSRMDTVYIHFQRGADAMLPAGELCEVVCEAYVASALSTGIALHGVEFHDASGSEECLASETVPDTTAEFRLNRACGDTTLAQVLGRGSILLDAISPNPTTGVVTLTFDVPQGYASDAMLEIYNALGEKLGARQIEFPAGATGKQTIDLNVNETPTNDGVRYLRILTSTGYLSAKVMLMSEH
jgi:hypothetical protein